MFGRPALPLSPMLAALAALVPVGPPAAAAVASAPVVVVGGGASTQRDVVTLLGGSHDLLVYELQHRLASDVAGPTGLAASPPYAVIARTRTGTKQTLATDAAIPNLQSWSVAGPLVTARSASDQSLVDWWDTESGRQGTVTTPPGNRYLSAAPRGVLSMAPDGAVVFQNLSGVPTAWANPFGDRPSEVFAGTGPDGVVLSDTGGHARYLRYAHPTSSQPLSLGHRTPGQGGVVTCWAVSAHYAACTTQGESRPNHGELVPLDGKPAIHPRHADERFGPVGLIHGDHLVWQRFSGGGSSGVLATISPKHPKPVIGSRHPMFGALRSAYGTAITEPRTGDELWKARSAKQVAVLKPTPRSPATATELALTGHEILDIDDVKSGGASRPALAVGRRMIDEPTTGVQVGPGERLARPSGPFLRNVVASGSRFAFTTSKDGYLGTLHVIGPKQTTTIHHVVTAADVSLSGHWVAYRAQAPGQFARRLHVRNLASGKDVTVTKQGNSLWSAAAIGHGTLYFAKARSGRIVALDLATGKESELSGSLAPESFAQIRVYASGSRVGWEIVQGGDTNPKYTDVVRAPDGTTTEVTGHLVGLSASGALVSTTPTGRFGFAASAEPTDITLRGWDGTVTPLLTDVRLAAEPQLAADVLAWLTSDGVLRVARLS